MKISPNERGGFHFDGEDDLLIVRTSPTRLHGIEFNETHYWDVNNWNIMLTGAGFWARVSTSFDALVYIWTGRFKGERPDPAKDFAQRQAGDTYCINANYREKT